MMSSKLTHCLLVLCLVVAGDVGIAAASERAFAGSLREGDSELLHMGARHYDPSTGRFLQIDPLGIGADQLYAYAAHNPYLYWDPSGFSPIGIADWDGFGPSRAETLIASAYESLLNSLGEPAPNRIGTDSLCIAGCPERIKIGGVDLADIPFLQNVGGLTLDPTGAPGEFAEASVIGGGGVFGELLGPGKLVKGEKFRLNRRRFAGMANEIDLAVIPTRIKVRARPDGLEPIDLEFAIALKKKSDSLRIRDPQSFRIVAQQLANETIARGASRVTVRELDRVPMATSAAKRTAPLKFTDKIMHFFGIR